MLAFHMGIIIVYFEYLLKSFNIYTGNKILWVFVQLTTLNI